MDCLRDGAEQFETFERPVVEAVTGDVDASLFEHFRLAVKWEMKCVFSEDEFVGFGVCQVGFRVNGFLNGFEIIEAFDAAMVPILFCRAFCYGCLLR